MTIRGRLKDQFLLGFEHKHVKDWNLNLADWGNVNLPKR